MRFLVSQKITAFKKSIRSKFELWIRTAADKDRILVCYRSLDPAPQHGSIRWKFRYQPCTFRLPYCRLIQKKYPSKKPEVDKIIPMYYWYLMPFQLTFMRRRCLTTAIFLCSPGRSDTDRGCAAGGPEPADRPARCRGTGTTAARGWCCLRRVSGHRSCLHWLLFGRLRRFNNACQLKRTAINCIRCLALLGCDDEGAAGVGGCLQLLAAWLLRLAAEHDLAQALAAQLDNVRLAHRLKLGALALQRGAVLLQDGDSLTDIVHPVGILDQADKS